MKTKKSKSASLEENRGLFLQLGLVVALLLTLWAFEWSSSDVGVIDLGVTNYGAIEQEIIPITKYEVEKPKPKIENIMAEIIDIVDDEQEIDEELEIENAEVDEDDAIEFIPLEDEVEEEVIFVAVEQWPEFNGGLAALRKWLAKNVNYPNLAKDQGIQGKVFVRFVVSKTGEVEKVTLARGVDPLLDTEALRVVNRMPKWKPGKMRNKPVNVWYTVPINFVLQN